jgi:hypothetical protein
MRSYKRVVGVCLRGLLEELEILVKGLEDTGNLGKRVWKFFAKWAPETKNGAFHLLPPHLLLALRYS